MSAVLLPWLWPARGFQHPRKRPRPSAHRQVLVHHLVHHLAHHDQLGGDGDLAHGDPLLHCHIALLCFFVIWLVIDLVGQLTTPSGTTI